MEPTRYRITVQGRMTERLGPAFDGLDIEPGNVQITLVVRSVISLTCSASWAWSALLDSSS